MSIFTDVVLLISWDIIISIIWFDLTEVVTNVFGKISVAEVTQVLTIF